MCSSDISKKITDQINDGFLKSNIIKENLMVKQEEELPSFGIIARSQIREINFNYNFLYQKYLEVYHNFKQIFEVAKYRTCFSCIKEASPGYISAYYDISFHDYDEIVTDLPFIYEKI